MVCILIIDVKIIVEKHWLSMAGKIHYIHIHISVGATKRKTSTNFEVINEKVINKAVTATLGFTL